MRRPYCCVSAAAKSSATARDNEGTVTRTQTVRYESGESRPRFSQAKRRHHRQSATRTPVAGRAPDAGERGMPIEGTSDETGATKMPLAVCQAMRAITPVAIDHSARAKALDIFE